MRLRNNPNAKIELEKWKHVIKDFPYKIKDKTIIELGMGKGEMITTLAKENININYIGIEKYATVAHKAMKRAKEIQLNNFYIICEDIKKLPELVKGKVDVIWLTFSDPWPKSKHEKRRLTHIDFINLYSNILSSKGVIKFKTDNDKLFEWTIKHLEENKIKLNNITRDFHNHKSSLGNVKTGYELKWSSQGKKINYLEIKL